jgi:biopolymer transport protein ExbD
VGAPAKANGQGKAGHDHRRWRLSGRKKPHVDVVRNDINVTPLVDVMLVLLIIFMLMTMTMGRGHDVTLPTAQYYSSEKDKNQPIVSVDLQGELFIEKTKIGPINESTLKEMRNQVEAAWEAPGVDRRLFLKADARLEYGKIYPVIVYMHRELGLTQIDLAIGKGDGG